MAFGISRMELEQWKEKVSAGEIAFITHYWIEPRYPGVRSITKVGCSDIEALSQWCRRHGLNPSYIHHRTEYPHFDLIGPRQKEILSLERQWEQISRFGL